MATLREMEAALEALAVDPAVRALVLTGAGDRAFAAGADINEIRGLHEASGGMEMSRFRAAGLRPAGGHAQAGDRRH